MVKEDSLSDSKLEKHAPLNDFSSHVACVTCVSKTEKGTVSIFRKLVLPYSMGMVKLGGL